MDTLHEMILKTLFHILSRISGQLNKTAVHLLYGKILVNSAFKYPNLKAVCCHLEFKISLLCHFDHVYPFQRGGLPKIVFKIQYETVVVESQVNLK